MKRLISILMILSFCPSVGLAGGKLIGNGGDSSPLGFVKIAQKAISEAKGFPELQDVDLNDVLLRAKILLSEVPVHAKVNGVQRALIAVSYRPDKIVLFKQRWEAMRNMALRKAIALHALLALTGKESPGNYPISKRYLTGLGVQCANEQGLCENSIVYHCMLLKNMNTKPEELGLSRIGLQGGRKETLRLGEGSLHSEVFLNIQADRSHFKIWMYRNGRAVNKLELQGTNFPPLVLLEWFDPESSDTYGTFCTQQ